MPDENITSRQKASEDEPTGIRARVAQRGSYAAKVLSRLVLFVSWLSAIFVVSLSLHTPSGCDRNFIGCAPAAEKTPSQSVPAEKKSAQVGRSGAGSTGAQQEATAAPTTAPLQEPPIPPREPGAELRKSEAANPQQATRQIDQSLLLGGANLTDLYNRFGPSRAIELSVLAVIIAPYLIGWWIFLILRFAIFTIDYHLQVPSDLVASNSYWAERARSVQFSWDYESLGRERTQLRAEEYAHLVGWFTSLALAGGVLLLVHTPAQHPEIQPTALTIVAAILTSFLLETGAVFVRIANNDVSARLFATTLHTLLTVIIAAAFLPAVLRLLHETVLTDSTTAQALLGIAVGLTGRSALGVITARANSLLGIKTVTPENRADLKTSIDGMNEEDIDRLAEEGVDSVHALAYTPTPRLFFGTLYRLPRICDWQDQALLIELAGQSLAQAFRNNLYVRGAIDAQAVAWMLLNAAGGGSSTSESQIPVLDSRRTPIKLEKVDDCFKLLGLTTNDQALVALSTLAADSRIDELRIYYVSEVEKEERASDVDKDDPNKNRFGRRAVRGGRAISATLSPSSYPGMTTIRLTVQSTNPENHPLKDPVTFYLHPTFHPSTPTMPVIEGKAVLNLDAWGVFTVGASTDKNKTRLELDLAYVGGANEVFYTR